MIRLCARPRAEGDADADTGGHRHEREHPDVRLLADVPHRRRQAAGGAQPIPAGALARLCGVGLGIHGALLASRYDRLVGGGE